MLKNISQTLRQQISTSAKKANRVNERLSSGKRINRAADDAAALALSSRSKARAASIERANRNIGEAMSALRYADSGAAAIYDSLSKML